MGEELPGRRGLTWSPAVFDAVATRVAAALEGDDEVSPFAEHLVQRGRSA